MPWLLSSDRPAYASSANGGDIASFAAGRTDPSGWDIRSTTVKEDLPKDPLAVTVNIVRKTDKSVYLDVFNTDGSKYNNNKYRPFTLRVEFKTRAEELTGDKLNNVKKKLAESGVEKRVEKVWNVSFGAASIKPPKGTE